MAALKDADHPATEACVLLRASGKGDAGIVWDECDVDLMHGLDTVLVDFYVVQPCRPSGRVVAVPFTPNLVRFSSSKVQTLYEYSTS